VNLSPHFTLAEATASAKAREIGDANQPTATHLANLRAAAAQMERVRALFGRPVQVTSWYRNPRVNRAVGGVPTSHHALGWAIDFRISGVDGLDAARRIAASDLRFDQLIWYRPSGIVHLSFHPQLRRQVRTNPTTAAGASLITGLVP
jgi:zinc D-Ala-D-Ala carboxypeptidase